MGEIIQIQVGQCGNRIGSNFWNTISDEHGLDEDGRFAGYSGNTQLDRINVYYDETPSGVYSPRAVLVDSDPTSLFAVGAGTRPCGRNVFRPESFVAGRGCTGGNWARGFHSAADGLPGRVMEALRSAAERCDRLQGVQIVHSLGGGTGGGLGARIADAARVALPGRTVNTHSVVPSSAVSGDAATVETFNAALSAARLAGGAAHGTYVADNRALYNACAGPMGIGAPAYADLNRLTAQTMSGVTTALRFAGPDDAADDMAKCTARLVPYARMHFFVTGFAPVTYRGQTDPCARPVADLAAGLFAAVSRCAGAPDQRRPVVLTAACTFRGCGRLRPADVFAVRRVAGADSGWLPDNVTASGYDVPSRGLGTSGTIVANTTAVADVLNRLCRRYVNMLGKKKLLHLYTNEGMAVSDFQHAREQIESLLAEYQSLEENHDGHSSRTEGETESRLINSSAPPQ